MTKIAVIDIETTGFSSTKDKIVEIGIVSLDLMNGNIKTVFSEFIKEDGLTVNEFTKSWIFENSDITLNHIVGAKNLQTYFDEIQNIIYDHTLGMTAFNNTFDFGFLQKRGFVIPRQLRDPMKISENIVKATDKNGRIKYPTAEEAYRHFFPGDNYVEKHRGADDAKHEAKVIYSLYKLGLF